MSGYPGRAAGRTASGRPADRRKAAANSWRTVAWRDAPSWLVSAVLHLSVLILLGLVFCTAEPTEIEHIRLSWAAAKAPEVEPPHVEAHSPAREQPEGSAGHGPESPPTVEKPAPATKQAAAAADEPPRAIEQASGNRESAAVPNAPAKKPALQGGPLLAASQRPPDVIQPSAPREASAKVSSLRSPEMARYERLATVGSDDAVVDRFTLADIGKLGGRAGQEAKAQFAGLGTDAIPALVRGLNRSANIAHSCPVAEIYRKLDDLLAKCDDPYLLLYALENTGQGLNPRAEHWRQIVAARNSWHKKYHERTAAVREQLDRELRPQRPLEAGRPLSEADADELALAVVHTDAKVREEALATIAKRGMTFGDAERFQIAQPLIVQLEDAEQSVRHAARRTLVALSGGREIGPSQDSLDRDPAAAAAWWRDCWTQFVLTQSLARGRSSALVEGLASSGREERVAALRKLVEQRPVLPAKQRIAAGRALVALLADDEENVQETARTALRTLANGTGVDATAAGGEAQAWSEYWDAVELRQVLEPQAGSLLGMARSLEDRGAADAARRYYERIVREFPRTSAAVLAKARLGE